MVTVEESLRVLRTKMPEFLRMHRLPLDKPFLCVNPEHEHDNNTPSMSYHPASGRVKCFGKCDKSFDVLDMVQFMYKINDFKKALFKAEELFNLPHATFYTSANGLQYKESDFMKNSGIVCDTYEGNPLKEYVQYYNYGLRNSNVAEDYLVSRGINRNLVQKFFIGCRTDYRNDNKEYTVLLFPRDRCHYSVRPLTPAGKDANGFRYKKHGKGPAMFAVDCAVEAFQSGRPLFVTEGEIDALSIMTAGGLAVALCGRDVAPLYRLVALAEKATGKKSVIVACCDNDEPGYNANLIMRENLTEKGFECIFLNVYGSCKDANEALQESPERFKKYISESQTEEGLKNLLLQDAYCNEMSSSDIVEAICKEKKTDVSENGSVVPTGFKMLDNMLGGGFYPGLYVVSTAVMSAGTAFMLQISDYIASLGRDVLYFSYGATKEELCARSISRTLCLKNTDSTKKNFSYLDILYKQMEKLDVDVVRQAKKCYLKMSDEHIYMAEGFFSVDTLCSMVERHKEVMHAFPVVVVDYLQAMPIGEQFHLEKDAFRNIVRKLSYLSVKHKIPVILLNYVDSEEKQEKSFLASYGVFSFLSISFPNAKQYDVISKDTEIAVYGNRIGRFGKFNLEYLYSCSYFSER